MFVCTVMCSMLAVCVSFICQVHVVPVFVFDALVCTVLCLVFVLVCSSLVGVMFIWVFLCTSIMCTVPECVVLCGQ